jgi:hypothetical protein
MSTPAKQLKRIMKAASAKRWQEAEVLFNNHQYIDAVAKAEPQSLALLRELRDNPVNGTTESQVAWQQSLENALTTLGVFEAEGGDAHKQELIRESKENLNWTLGFFDWSYKINKKLRKGFDVCKKKLTESPHVKCEEFTATYEPLLKLLAERKVNAAYADFYYEELLALTVKLNRSDLQQWLIQLVNKPSFAEKATQLLEAEACAACLRDEPGISQEDFATRFGGRIQFYINNYRDPNENTLLHLAVKAKREDLIIWMNTKANPDRKANNRKAINKAGLYAFGLPEAFAFSTTTLSYLTFDMFGSSEVKQVIAHCVTALTTGNREALRVWRGLYTPSWYGSTHRLEIPESQLGFIAWLCAHPELPHLLPIYFDACGAEGFWSEYERPENILHLSSHEGDQYCDNRLNWQLTPIIERLQPGKLCGLRPIEVAVLFGNTQAAIFLLKHLPSSRKDVLAPASVNISRDANSWQFIDNNYNSTMAWHYLMARDQGAIPSAETVELTCLLATTFPEMLPDYFMKLMTNAKYKSVFNYNATLYPGIQAHEDLALKSLVHRVCFQYFFVTCPNYYNTVGEHGEQGRDRALQFLAKVVEATSARHIWQLTRDLLTLKPQKLLQDNSFRALLIQALFLGREAYPNPLQVPAVCAQKPWTEASQIAFGTLLCIQKLSSVAEQAGDLNTPERLVSQLKAAINAALGVYFEKNWQAQSDKLSGFKHALSIWQFLNTADTLSSLYYVRNYLKLNSSEELSLRPCVVDCILNSPASMAVGYVAGVTPQTKQANLLQALERYIDAQNYGLLQRASALKTSVFGGGNPVDEAPAPAPSKGAQGVARSK